MKKLLIFSVLAVLLFGSCEKYDEDILPMVGIYEAYISGVAGPFSMNIVSDYGDNIIIQAPWLEDIDERVEADIDEVDHFRKKIQIHEQYLGKGRRIYGEGAFQDYSIQIDYTIVDGNELYHYTLVGTKL